MGSRHTACLSIYTSIRHLFRFSTFIMKQETLTCGNLSAGLNFARRIGLNQMFSVSGIYEYLTLTPRYVSESGLDNISYNYIKPSIHYGINTLDTKHFPNKGTIFDLSGSTSRLISASIRTDTEKSNYDIGNTGDFSFDRYLFIERWFQTIFLQRQKSDIFSSCRCSLFKPV